MYNRTSRKVTNKILEDVQEGILNINQVLLACLNHMSEFEVRNMAEANGFYENEDEDEVNSEDELVYDEL